MWTCLKEYLRQLCRHYWTLGIGGVGGVLGLCLDVFTSLSVPAWLWSTSFIAALVIAQFLVYLEAYSSITTDSHITPGRRRALPTIARSIREGESLHAEIKFMKDYEISLSRDRVAKWVKDTFAKIQKHDQSLAERFGDTDGLDARPAYAFYVTVFLRSKIELLNTMSADVKRYS